MKNSIKTILSIIIILLTTNFGYSQEFLADGSMKITKIAENPKYGYKPKRKYSIKVGKIENEYAYLMALRGPNGEKINFERIGSCCSFKSNKIAFGKGFLDKFEITYKGIPKPIYLYLNGYEYEKPKCPIGLTFISNANKTKSSPSINFTEVCDKENIYSVDDYALKEKYGNLNNPDKNPSFKGGIEKLKKYFSVNNLTESDAVNYVFRVKIGFIVNCNGKAVNFTILSKGKGKLRTYAENVLKIVEKMPQNWIAGKVNGKNVDIMQILSFTVVKGKLDKVSYR